MPYNPQWSIEGIQEVLSKNIRRIAAMQPGGRVEDVVRDAVIALHRYAVQITHVGQYPGGGALKSSHRMKLDGLEGIVFIDPSSVSPRRGNSKQRPAIYGVFENERGGEHAFYDRTVYEIGDAVSGRARQQISEIIVNGQ